MEWYECLYDYSLKKKYQLLKVNNSYKVVSVYIELFFLQIQEISGYGVITS